MTMTDKLTPNTMKGQYDHQYNVFCRKNHDYGNSFEKSLDTFGLVAGIVRMNDKFERLVSLNDPSKDAQIASESLVDTLEDLSNYAAMAACWLKGKKKANWNELRMKALDGNIESIIKNADTIVNNMKGESKIHSKDELAAMNIETGKIEFHPNFTKAIFKGPKEKNDNVDLYWANKLNDNMAVGGDIKIEDKPKFSGIHLHGPEKLELNLNVDRETFDKVMADVRHPNNLPKSVYVNYNDKVVYEFPYGIDTIASYLKQLSKEESKKENDRVMLDMMLSRIEKGEVVRIVANGDGSFTTYFEKTDGPFDKIVDKEDESIFHEREGWEEEDKKKTLNDIRKEHGFDPVNGEDNEG